MSDTADRQPVIVTTERRGLFFGRLVEHDRPGRRVVLADARCGIYWATSGGFLELAEQGPNSKSRVGAQAPRIELDLVTSVVTCTPAAAEAWEQHGRG